MNNQTSKSEHGFDELLADYFDWCDASDDHSVSAFVKVSDHWNAQPRLVEELRQFVDDNTDIEDLANSTVSRWLGLEHLSGNPRVDSTKPPVRLANYELLSEVGRGGMGVVYRARHQELQRNVCVKLMLQGSLANKRDVDRFLAEAQAMAALRHPNIVAVHDVGEQDDHYFFVMDEIEGQTLKQRVADAPLPDRAAAEMLLAIAHAVEYAHSRGVLHRDLKPANILLDENEIPYVSDFGLARQIEADSLTTAPGIAGTPAYLAPELTQGQSATKAADIYGLGTILFESLTAQPPYQGVTPLDTLLKVRRDEPPAPSTVRKNISRDLETICLTCIAKTPGERYSSVSDVVEELERFLRGEPVKARRLSMPVRVARWMRRYPLVVALASTVLLASITVAALQWRAIQKQSKTLSELQASQDSNVALIEQLEEEQKILQHHLYLSGIGQTQQAIQHGNISEAETLLEGLKPSTVGEPPQSESDVDHRGWEWHYLKRQTAQYNLSFEGHQQAVLAVAIAKGSDEVVSLDINRVLRWDPSTGEVQSTTETLSPATHLAWSERNESLAIATRDGVRVIGGGSDRMVPIDEFRSVRSLAWNALGTRLAMGLDNGQVAVIRIDEARPTIVDAGASDSVNALSWHKTDDVLAAASDDGTIHVVGLARTARNASPVKVAALSGWVNDVVFAPQGGRIAAVANGGELMIANVELNSTSDQIEVSSPEIHRAGSNNDFTSLAWDPGSNQLAVGISTGVIKIWDVPSSRFARSLYGHRDSVTSIDWSVDDRLVSSSSDGTAKTWELSQSRDGQNVNPAETPVRTVVWNIDGSQAAWRDVEGMVARWNAAKRRLDEQFLEPANGATALAWNSKIDRLAYGRAESAFVSATNTDEPMLELRGENAVWVISFGPEAKRVATAGAGKAVHIWDSETGKTIAQMDGHGEGVRSVVWLSPDDICTIDETATLRRWEIASDSSEPLMKLKLPTNFATAMAVHPKGTHLAVATQEGPIYTVDLATFVVGLAFRGHQGTTWSATYDSTGERLISGGQDGTLRIWDTFTGSEALQLQAHDAAVWSVSLHDQKLLSAGADGAVRLWDASSR